MKDWKDVFRENRTLYRKMSYKEVLKIIDKNGLVNQPKENIESYKYLTTSLTKAWRFINRYETTNQNDKIIMKFMLEPEYIEKLIENMSFNIKDPFGISLNLLTDKEKLKYNIVYNYSHEDILNYIDIGLSNLEIEEFNKYLKDFSIIEKESIKEEILSTFKKDKIKLNRDKNIDNNEYFIAYPFDLAVISCGASMLSIEGLTKNKVGRYISKDIDKLKEVSGYNNILRIKIDNDKLLDTLPKKDIMRLDKIKLHKLNRYVNDISFYEYDMKQELYEETDKKFIYPKHLDSITDKKDINDYELLPIDKHGIDNINKMLKNNELDINRIMEIIPLLKASENFIQFSELHKFDVLNHIVESVKNVEVAIDFLESWNVKFDLDEEDKVTLKWVMLLHDIAKPFCESHSKEVYKQFPKHEKIGAEISKVLLSNMKNDKADLICSYIENHGKFYDIKNNKKFIGKMCKVVNGLDMNKTEIDDVVEKKKRDADIIDKYIKMFMVVKVSDVIAFDSNIQYNKLSSILKINDAWQEVEEDFNSLNIKDINLSIGDIMKIVDSKSEEKMLNSELASKSKEISKVVISCVERDPGINDDDVLLGMIAEETAVLGEYI